MSLSVIQPKNEIRPSGTTKWRAGVLIAVGLYIAGRIGYSALAGAPPG